MESKSDLKPFKEFLRESLKEWSGLSDDEIEMTKYFSMCNDVYKVEGPVSKDLKPVIFRVFKAEVAGGVEKEKSLFLSRDEEASVFKRAAELKAGAQMYAVSDKYRIEEYIECKKFPVDGIFDSRIRRWLTYAVMKFNLMKVEGIRRQECLFTNYFREGNLFVKFDQKCALKSFNQEEQAIVDEVKDMTKKENIEFIKNLIEVNDTVMAHGDLNPLNLLVQKDTHKITLIDYERSGLAFRGDDFGNYLFFSVINFFHAGEPMYIESNLPTDEVIQDIAKYYWVFHDLKPENDNEEYLKKLVEDDSFFASILNEMNKDEFEDKVKKLARQIKIAFITYVFCGCVGVMDSYNPNSPVIQILQHVQNSYRLYWKLVNSKWYDS